MEIQDAIAIDEEPIQVGIEVPQEKITQTVFRLLTNDLSNYFYNNPKKRIFNTYQQILVPKLSTQVTDNEYVAFVKAFYTQITGKKVIHAYWVNGILTLEVHRSDGL